MGRFVNPDNSAFQAALNSRIYVDKTTDPEGSDRSFQSYIIPTLRLRQGRYRFHIHPYAAPLRSNGRAALRLLLLICAYSFSFGDGVCGFFSVPLYFPIYYHIRYKIRVKK